MMSWLRTVFQRHPEESGDAGSGGARSETREDMRQESVYESSHGGRQEGTKGGRAASSAAGLPALLGGLRRAREGLAALVGQPGQVSQVGQDHHPALRGTARALRRLESRLTRLPRLVVLGEFNSGKSALLNVLLGSSFVPGSVTRKGRVPVLLRHSSQPVLIAVDVHGRRIPVDEEALAQWRGAPLNRIEAGLPSPVLRRIEILDLPGLSHPTHDIGDLPLRASRNAHMALWCTSATQAWKGSEQRVWLAAPRRLRAHSVLVATHKDRLRLEADCEKVRQRLLREAAPYFRSVALFSSRSALRARDETLAVTEPDLWLASGADALMAAVADMLTSLAAEREAAAARTARRLANRLLRRVEAPRQAGRGALSQPVCEDGGSLALLAHWSRLAEGLAARVAPETVGEPAFLEEMARVIQDFGANAIEPWLRRQPWTDASARLAALFRCDATMIAEAIEGLPPPAAAQRLHGALRQLYEELSEALADLSAPGGAAHPQAAAIRQALQPLLAAGGAA